MQYGLIVWRGCADNAMKPLITQQNQAIRICLNKYDLKDSSVSNYKKLKVFPIRFLYKQFTILISVSKNISKRECRAYDLQVEYIKKFTGKHFLDFLRPSNFNAMPLYLKQCIFNNANKISNYIVNKNSIVNWLFSKL